jgi:hypothetical protein
VTSKPIVNIGISQVPAEKQNDHRFLALCGKLRLAFSSSSYVEAFCVHEAAHGIYFLRAGATRLIFGGPTISYDTGQDTFTANAASITAVGYSDEFLGRIGIREWISAMARGYVAGGVAARILAKVPNDGDEEDHRSFLALCNAICAQNTEFTVDRPAAWKQAQDEVARELRIPSLRIEVHQRADEFKAWLQKEL